MIPPVVWTGKSLGTVLESARDRATDLVEELVQNFMPPVTQVRLFADESIKNAGEFRFSADDNGIQVKAQMIRVNIPYCRTIHDLVYVTLHEIRHAHQFTKLGWKTMLLATRELLTPDSPGDRIEQDAMAWALDTMPNLPIGRRKLLTGRTDIPSIHSIHKSLRPALVRWF